MSRDWIPRRDVKLRDFTASFEKQISANPASFGLTVDEANEFAALNEAWQAAFTAANRNGTRTPTAIVVKDDARTAVVAMLRSLGMAIQKRPQTTNDQRTALGLRVPSPYRTPIGRPQSAPMLHVYSVLGQTVKITLRDLVHDGRRGKPFGVAGATIYVQVAEKASSNTSDWVSLGNFTRPKISLTLPTWLCPPGSKIWLAACWYNPRGQAGPMSHTADLYLPGGITMLKTA